MVSPGVGQPWCFVYSPGPVVLYRGGLSYLVHLSREVCFFSISAQQNSLCILGHLATHAYCIELNSLGAERVAKTGHGQLEPDAICMAPNKARVWQPLRSLKLCGHPTVATSLVRSLQSSLGHLYNFSSPTFLCKNSCLVRMPLTTCRFPLSVYPWQSSWPETAKENWNHSLWQPGHGSNELYKCSMRTKPLRAHPMVSAAQGNPNCHSKLSCVILTTT